jgi:hypothetical protein
MIMKKELLERFIVKYRLNGIIDSAVWTVSDGTLRVAAMGWSGKLFAGVTCPRFYECDNAAIGILDTKKLLGMLKAIPSEDVSLKLVKYSWGDVAALILADAMMRVEYVTTNLKAMDGIPKMKNLPAWNAVILLDDEFKAWFFKAYSAVGNKSSLLTVAMAERTGTLEVSIDDGSSGSLRFRPHAPINMNVVKSPIFFSAYCLRQVLKANSEFNDTLLIVSDAGLASIKCRADDLGAEYYLVKIDVED